MPNWKTLEAKDKLLAALVAAHPDKKLLDYRRIATYYGEGTTYDAIEGQFRIIRREAQKLREAVDSGEQAQAPPRGSGNGNAAGKPRAQRARTATTKKAAATTTGGAKRAAKPTQASQPGNNASTTAPAVPQAVLSGRVVKSTTPSGGSFGNKRNEARFEEGVIRYVDENSFTSVGSRVVGGAGDKVFNVVKQEPMAAPVAVTHFHEEDVNDTFNATTQGTSFPPSSGTGEWSIDFNNLGDSGY